MKRNIQLTVCATAAALGLCALAPSGWAQAASSASANIQSGTKLGKVERATKVTGKEVYSSDNHKIGKIDNVVVDMDSGRILYVVVGAKNKVAVPPEIFREPSGDNVHATATKAQIESAPQFTSDIDKPGNIGQASFVSQVYQHFGQPAWWQGAGSAATGSFNTAHKTSDLDGMKVLSQNNQTLGKVNNVALDLPPGRVVYVVLTPDASLKMGDNLLALPPNAFGWNPNQNALVVSMSRQQLAAAPHFNKDNWGHLSNPSFAARVYQYYGKQPWFEGGGMQPTGR